MLRELFSSVLVPKVPVGEHSEALPCRIKFLEVRRRHLMHVSIVSSDASLHHEAKKRIG